MVVTIHHENVSSHLVQVNHISYQTLSDVDGILGLKQVASQTDKEHI